MLDNARERTTTCDNDLLCCSLLEPVASQARLPLACLVDYDADLEQVLPAEGHCRYTIAVKVCWGWEMTTSRFVKNIRFSVDVCLVFIPLPAGSSSVSRLQGTLYQRGAGGSQAALLALQLCHHCAA